MDNNKNSAEWEDYKISVIDTKNKSQDDFEKYINLLASGGIIISLAIAEKSISLPYFESAILLILGAFLLIVTILTNLLSHYLSMINCDKTLSEIKKGGDNLHVNVKSRNKIIHVFNAISIGALILGIVMILIFVTINFMIYEQ